MSIIIFLVPEFTFLVPIFTKVYKDTHVNLIKMAQCSPSSLCVICGCGCLFV